MKGTNLGSLNDDEDLTLEENVFARVADLNMQAT